MTLQEIEAALDAGQISMSVGNGRWWKLRRNGQTKTWKSRPGEFRIPVRAGLRTCGQLTHNSVGSADFRVESD